MTYLLDTNILLIYVRGSKYADYIDEVYAPLSSTNTPIISVVSIGEIKSLAIRNNWGSQKLLLLKELLDVFIVADINVESILERYAEIDTYSQRKLKDRPLNSSSITMGKNDLWIAATASVLEVKLLTTDKDFDHLKDEFVDLERIDLSQL